MLYTILLRHRDQSLLSLEELVLTQCNAERPGVVIRSGVKQQSSPAAADIQETLVRLQAQLAANEVELVSLGRLQRLAPGRKIRARIHHLIVEKQPVEVVRHIVVMANGVAIACLAVRPAADVCHQLPWRGRKQTV